jgi:hypothetical protein
MDNIDNFLIWIFNERVFSELADVIEDEEKIFDGIYLPRKGVTFQIYHATQYILENFMLYYSSMTQMTLEENLQYALECVFPKTWLIYAFKAPESEHFDLTLLLKRYFPKGVDARLERVLAKLLEFLFYEIVENAFLVFGIKVMSELTVENVSHIISMDPEISRIFSKHSIYITDTTKIMKRDIVVHKKISHKAHKLLRIYMTINITEELIQLQNAARLLEKNLVDISVIDIVSYLNPRF